MLYIYLPYINSFNQNGHFADGTNITRGAEVTMFKALAEHLNFEYVINKPSRGNGFGTVAGKNSTGMMGEIILDLSDIGWGQLYSTYSFFDTTVSYDFDEACLIVSDMIYTTIADIYCHCSLKVSQNYECKHYKIIFTLQHCKPGDLSPIFTIYRPYSNYLWIALSSAVLVGLLFTVIYVTAHPYPEGNLYHFIFFLLASMIEESNLRSNDLKSITARNRVQ